MGTTASAPRRGRAYPVTATIPSFTNASHTADEPPLTGHAPATATTTTAVGYTASVDQTAVEQPVTTADASAATERPVAAEQPSVEIPVTADTAATIPSAPVTAAGERVAVALHVGSVTVLPELLTYTQRLQNPHTVFANIVEGLVDVAEARRIITYYYPNAVITVSENRGMDIGGFFRVLPFILQGDFDYILKLHTKTNHNWRRTLIEPLVDDEACLGLFRRDPTVGLVGARRCLYEELPHRRPNAYYCQQLAERYQLPYRDFRFIGGTMFWMRVSVLTSLWPRDTIEEKSAAALATLNTPETLDPHWFMINYRTARSVAEAVQQYQRQRGKFRNCLEARLHGVAAVADGMIEHAYERFFGMLTEARGYRVVGV